MGGEEDPLSYLGAEMLHTSLLDRTLVDNDRRYSKTHREITGQPRVSFPSRRGELWMQMADDFGPSTEETPYTILAAKEEREAMIEALRARDAAKQDCISTA